MRGHGPIRIKNNFIGRDLCLRNLVATQSQGESHGQDQTAQRAGKEQMVPKFQCT